MPDSHRTLTNHLVEPSTGGLHWSVPLDCSFGNWQAQPVSTVGSSWGSWFRCGSSHVSCASHLLCVAVPHCEATPGPSRLGRPGGWMFFFQSVKIETSCYETPCKKSELYLFNRGIVVVGFLMISRAISILIWSEVWSWSPKKCSSNVKSLSVGHYMYLNKFYNKVSWHLWRVIGALVPLVLATVAVPTFLGFPLSHMLSSQTKNVRGPCEMGQGKVDFVFQRWKGAAIPASKQPIPGLLVPLLRELRAHRSAPLFSLPPGSFLKAVRCAFTL